MNYKKVIFILILFVFFALNACMMQRVAGGKIAVESLPKAENSYRLIFLIKSDICIKTDVNKKQEELKCLKFGKAGWYPIDFSRSDLLRFENHYNPKLVKIIRNIPPSLLKAYNFKASKQIVYIPEYTIVAFSQIPRKNAILVRLHGSKRDTNVSSYLTLFSLLIIPGFFEEHLETEIIVYNKKGKAQPIAKVDEAYMQLWIGWVFSFWGAFASDSPHDLLISKINMSLKEFKSEVKK